MTGRWEGEYPDEPRPRPVAAPGSPGAAAGTSDHPPQEQAPRDGEDRRVRPAAGGRAQRRVAVAGQPVCRTCGKPHGAGGPCPGWAQQQPVGETRSVQEAGGGLGGELRTKAGTYEAMAWDLWRAAAELEAAQRREGEWVQEAGGGLGGPEPDEREVPWWEV